MNLHRIVSGAIGAVNPLRQATLLRSTGYTLLADGTRVPQYATFANVTCQIQELTQKDFAQVDGLNIQGAARAVYLNGKWGGIIRAGGTGGDMIQLDDGTMWLVVSVPESWPGWSKLIVVIQNGS